MLQIWLEEANEHADLPAYASNSGSEVSLHYRVYTVSDVGKAGAKVLRV